MQTLWAPWRSQYVSGQSHGRRGIPALLEDWPGPDTGCVFCNLLGSVRWAVASGRSVDEVWRAAGILRMGRSCFICLNAFPYTSGHVLLMPYLHVPTLMAVPLETATEMIETAQRIEQVLREVYRPDGLNLGCNIGEAAGAGVAGHLHMHVLPRWAGDTNFLTAVGETRVAPEGLDVTWSRLHPRLTCETTPALATQS